MHKCHCTPVHKYWSNWEINHAESQLQPHRSRCANIFQFSFILTLAKPPFSRVTHSYCTQQIKCNTSKYIIDLDRRLQQIREHVSSLLLVHPSMQSLRSMHTCYRSCRHWRQSWGTGGRDSPDEWEAVGGCRWVAGRLWTGRKILLYLIIHRK